jgi:hypothetical protein
MGLLTPQNCYMLVREMMPPAASNQEILDIMLLPVSHMKPAAREGGGGGACKSVAWGVRGWGLFFHGNIMSLLLPASVATS